MTKVPSQYKLQKIFWTLVVLVFVLIGSYLGLLGKTVHNVFERQVAEKEAKEDENSVSELEYSYLTLKSSINEEKAVSLGYVSNTDVTIVSKNSPKLLTLKN